MRRATGPTAKPSTTLREARAQLEKELVQGALILQDGNITKAAENLGISRQALHDLINKFRLGKAE